MAPPAFHSYQADFLLIKDKQFPNQGYPFGLSMIDVFSRHATVIPFQDGGAKRVMLALFKGFKDTGKQPDILYTDEEGALVQKDVAP